MDKEDEQIHKVSNVNAILFLYYIEELSVNDISCIEGISQKDVCDILTKTKEAIRKQFYRMYNNAFIEWVIVMIIVREMRMNALNEKQSKRMYESILCKVKTLS